MIRLQWFIALWLLSPYAVGQVFTSNGATVSIGSGGQLTVKGSTQFNFGSVLDNYGILDLTGDFENNASNLYQSNYGFVEFNGTSQEINGGWGVDFVNLTLTNGTKVTLQNSISTGGGDETGVLALNDGRLLLNGNDVTVANFSPNAITRTSGFIVSETAPPMNYSRVAWRFNQPLLNVYTWPFGSDVTGEYLPVSIDFTASGLLNLPTGTFTVSTYPTDPSNEPNNRPLPFGLTVLEDQLGNENGNNCVDRWWVISTEGYGIKPTGDVTLSYQDNEANGGNNTVSESSFGAQFNDGALWSQPPTGIPDPVGNKVTAMNQSEWDFAWTLVNAQQPLPVELLEFDAHAIGQEVLCEWRTLSELNNDFFEVERSNDAADFYVIGEVQGAGTSLIALNYSFLDFSPQEGWNYYRLVNVDFDGTREYSEVRAIYFESGRSLSIDVFPNPTTALTKCRIRSEYEGRITVQVHNSQGQLVQSWESLKEGKELIYPLDAAFLAAGVYSITIGMGTQTSQHLFLVSK